MPSEFIHRFVPGKSPYTVLALHGTGGDENDLLPVARGLAAGAAVLSPRGKVLERGAPRFFSRSAPGVFDEAEIRERVADLAEWIAWAMEKYALDAARVYALGYSNGANMAAATMLLAPGAIAGGLLLRPMVAITPPTLPELNGAPVLIASGQNDTTIPPEHADELARLLTKAGARVDLVVQNAGHELTPQDFGVGKQWFSRLMA